jgi:hypothetical protein
MSSKSKIEENLREETHSEHSPSVRATKIPNVLAADAEYEGT